MALENFIPSPENLMAYKLLSEIPSPFNPIYLYGPKGSGKTHLLTGVALALKKSGKRVFFVRAEAFTEHVVQAMRLGHMQDFRKIYREIDVLIVDDVHIFSRKTATQEEFFHTFNTLHTVGKPILLSAQTAPSQLVDIEPRLMSRFEWGISLGLERPDVSLILEKKASLWKVSLSPEIKDLLLKKFPRHPLLALQALSLRSKEKGVMTCELAERLLSDLLAKEEREALTPEKIIKAVAAHYGVRSEDLLGKSQMKEYVLPRQIAMYLCREHLKWPFQKIGQLFGRDHSTVMSSAKQVQKGIEKNTLEAILSIASLEKS
jgi:chromosomal replication initiator protein